MNRTFKAIFRGHIRLTWMYHSKSIVLSGTARPWQLMDCSFQSSERQLVLIFPCLSRLRSIKLQLTSYMVIHIKRNLLHLSPVACFLLLLLLPNSRCIDRRFLTRCTTEDTTRRSHGRTEENVTDQQRVLWQLKQYWVLGFIGLHGWPKMKINVSALLNFYDAEYDAGCNKK